ncbi:hypothetical protein HY995_02615 [Candidatus Micrarchaeota archaeon]|nr:hypothetical protein [Candidatus Micrarchaeota archaeon]
MTRASENSRRQGVGGTARIAKRLLPALALMGLLKAGEVKFNSAPRQEFERKVAAQSAAGMFERREKVDHRKAAEILGHPEYYLTERHTGIPDASGLINEAIRAEVARHNADLNYADASRFVTPDFIHAILIAESGLAPWDANFRVVKGGGDKAVVPLRNRNGEIFANGLGQVTDESLSQAIKDGAVPAGTKLFEMRPLIPPKAVGDALRSVSTRLDTSEFEEVYQKDLERFARMKGKTPRELTPGEIGAENERRIRLNVTNAVHTAFFNANRLLRNLINRGTNYNNINHKKLQDYLNLSYKDGGWGAFLRFRRNYLSASDRKYIANRRKALAAVQAAKTVRLAARPKFTPPHSVQVLSYAGAASAGAALPEIAKAVPLGLNYAAVALRRRQGKRRPSRRGKKAVRMASWN